MFYISIFNLRLHGAEDSLIKHRDECNNSWYIRYRLPELPRPSMERFSASRSLSF